MNTRQQIRASAILDGVTGVVSVPATIEVWDRRYSSVWRRHSDLEKSWTFVGKYLDIAIQDCEPNLRNSPVNRTAKNNA